MPEESFCGVNSFADRKKMQQISQKCQSCDALITLLFAVITKKLQHAYFVFHCDLFVGNDRFFIYVASRNHQIITLRLNFVLVVNFSIEQHQGDCQFSARISPLTMEVISMFVLVSKSNATYGFCCSI